MYECKLYKDKRRNPCFTIGVTLYEIRQANETAYLTKQHKELILKAISINRRW